MRDLFQEIQDYYGNPKPDRRGWIHVDCPFCGAKANRIKPNFSYRQHGGFCLSEQQKYTLKDIAQAIGLWTDTYDPSSIPVVTRRELRAQRQAPPPPEPEPAWKDNAEELVEMYAKHPETVSQWQAYKPLSVETIRKHRFGYGQLPGMRTMRLVVPTVQDGVITGLRGRLPSGSQLDAPPWISAKGSRMTLWNIDNVRAGDVLWICENYADAALLMQTYPDFYGEPMAAIALGGARVLRPEELQRIVSRKPSEVIIAFDNDLVGQAQGKRREQLEQKWLEDMRRRHPDRDLSRLHPPKSAAFRLANELMSMKMSTSLFEWDDAEAKADIGKEIMEG